jgi:hypothetical protein
MTQTYHGLFASGSTARRPETRAPRADDVTTVLAGSCRRRSVISNDFNLSEFLGQLGRVLVPEPCVGVADGILTAHSLGLLKA